MLENIETILRENCGLKYDRPVLVGVSGGPDSLCLLDIMLQSGYSVIAAHFDHKLRADSKLESKTLKKSFDKKNVSSVFGSGDVAKLAENERFSIEEAARELRYRFLFEQAQKHNVQAIAVGHTADDQVETVLMHFIRGAGLTGLKGMTHRSFLLAFNQSIPLVRPLLAIWRKETVTYCKARGLEPFHDPSNDSDEFLRNRIRHHLIPELETYNPRFREAAARTARTLAEDYSALTEVIDATWDECLVSVNTNLITFNANYLCTYAPGVQRNLVRRGLEHLAPNISNIRFSTLNNASKLLTNKHFGRVDLTGGMRLYLEGDLAYIAGKDIGLPFERWPQMPQSEQALELTLPGQIEIAGGWIFTCEHWRIPSLAQEQARNNENPFRVWLDASTLPHPIEIRARRAGDRFEPLGMKGHSMKLSDFFINEKLPQRARDAWPLLCSGKTVIWVPGYRPAHPYRLADKTRQIVYFTLTQKM